MAQAQARSDNLPLYRYLRPEGREWMAAKMPTVRGAKLELFEDKVFDDYYAAVWEVFRMRWEAATGLVKMKATESLEALEAFSRSLSQQSRVHGEELVTRLRASDKVDGSALKKDVEELQEKVRKLEDQLQKLQAKVEPPEEKE